MDKSVNGENKAACLLMGVGAAAMQGNGVEMIGECRRAGKGGERWGKVEPVVRPMRVGRGDVDFLQPSLRRDDNGSMSHEKRTEPQVNSNFDCLVNNISEVHEQLRDHAINAVNASLTGRNWIVGMFIKDSVYPQIAKSLISQLSVLPRSVQSMISLVSCPDDQETGNCAFPGIPSERLPGVLSFTHFIELIKIEDPLKRSFYEVESVRGTWSVRELKRQIASLYFERSGLSRDKRRLAEIVDERVKSSTMQQAIQDPYVFEFLGLRPNEVMPESNLEQALLHQLEAFLLELGRGFCFEARQRRILIGDEYFFVDLVFYHRILKCHVLIELKSGGFSHGAGQVRIGRHEQPDLRLEISTGAPGGGTDAGVHRGPIGGGGTTTLGTPPGCWWA